jgi:hypothetical protein
MDTVTLPSTEASEAFDGVQPPWASGNERGRGDTAGSPSAEAGEVTPGPTHHSYSDGIVCPGFCAWCGRPFHEHGR